MPIIDLLNKKKYVTQQEKAQRIAICERCKVFRRYTRQCGLCKCFVDAKTALNTERCPVGKWG